MGDQRTQPYVLLAPCYGNPKTRERYHKTIEGSIHFESREYRDLLDTSQLDALRSFHPTGAAHFWGAIATHDKTMDRLRAGDIVVFTGDNKIKAAGEIGLLFRNQPLADFMWDQYAEDRSFVNVYSVLNVQAIERPRQDLWDLDGFNVGDNIAGQRLVTDERVRRIVNEFNIETSAAEARIGAELAAVSRALNSGTRIVPVEGFHTDTVSQRVAERNSEYVRVESLLVSHYQQAHPDRDFTSFRTSSGKRADLYRVDDDDVELVEAKSLANHEKVREAAAQLLDYSAHCTEPVTRLSALFPLRPSQDSVDYLHRLGIDCVFRTDDGTFARDAASDDRRHYMHPVWHDLRKG